MSLIAVGDIHGCAAEFERLLEVVQPGPTDTLVLLGDLVNRGPAPRRVIELALAANAIALLGNHEHRLLTWRHFGDDRLLKSYDRPTLAELRETDWDYLERMRLHYEDPSLGVVCVHGGFLPGIPWKTQTVGVVTTIQVIDERGQPQRRADSPHSPHWSTLWVGPPYVVYGHTPRSEVQARESSIGIDTGCVHGGFLTAYILPERRIIQVRAKRPYSPRKLS